MANPVSFFQIQGGDAKGLTAFYKKVFGWKMAPAKDSGGMMMVAAETGGIAGGIGASMDGNKSVSVYVSVTDLERNLAKIKAAGGQPAMDPFELPGGMGRIAGFIDPVGNWIGLWDPGQPTKRGAQKAGRAQTAGDAAKPARGSASKRAARSKGRGEPPAPPRKPATKKPSPKASAAKKSARAARK